MADRFLQVVLKAKKCFKKSVTFAAVSYTDESGTPVCADNSCVALPLMLLLARLRWNYCMSKLQGTTCVSAVV
jgi:hypothetical protein